MFTDVLFKSHLYGIEIGAEVDGLVAVGVFKSHLYGIEM